jgi:hypothetical protein
MLEIPVLCLLFRHARYRKTRPALVSACGVCAATCPYGAGTFTDPTGDIIIPDQYAGSVTCDYLITTGAPIYLSFASFATESGWDFVFVYDGASVNGTLLGKFSGTATPGTQIAMSGSMFIHFTSDKRDALGGIVMTWSDVVPTPAPTYIPDGIPLSP